jgi:hypothetical protein
VFTQKIFVAGTLRQVPFEHREKGLLAGQQRTRLSTSDR